MDRVLRILFLICVSALVIASFLEAASVDAIGQQGSSDTARKREGFATGEVIVKFKEGASPESILEQAGLEAARAERVYPIKSVITRFKKDFGLEKDTEGWYWFRGKSYEAIDDIPDEELFKEASRNMSELEQGLFRTYKLALPEGEGIREAISALKKMEEVEYAEPNYIMEIQ